MMAAGDIDKLRRHSYAFARSSEAAFEHIADSQLAPNESDINGTVLISEHDVPGDNAKRLDPREPGGDVLGETIGELIEFRVSAHQIERQYGNGGLVAARRRCF